MNRIQTIMIERYYCFVDVLSIISYYAITMIKLLHPSTLAVIIVAHLITLMINSSFVLSEITQIIEKSLNS